MGKTLKLRIDKEHFNECYIPMLKYNDLVMETDARSLEKIYYGGSGSGKSEWIARAEVIIPFLHKKGTNTFVIMDTFKAIKRSAFPLLKKVLNEYLGPHKDSYVQILKDELKFINKKNGNEIICLGLEDPDAIKSTTFEHGNLTTAWVEEADRVKESAWKQLRQRMRGKTTVPYKRIASYNPTTEDAWCYKNFVKDVHSKSGYRRDGRIDYFFRSLEAKDEEGNEILINVPTIIMHSTCEDNKFVDEVYRAELRNEEDPYLRDIYYYGKPGVMKDSQCVIDYARAMRATEEALKLDNEEIIGIGCDVAGDGDDAMKLKLRIGPNQIDLQDSEENFKSNSTTDFARHIALVGLKYQRLRKKETGVTPEVVCNVDKTGVGKGTYDTLKDIQKRGKLQNWIINGVDFGGSANDKTLYANAATDMYYNIRDLINEDEIFLVNHTQTITELCTRYYEYVFGKDKTQYRLEPKKAYKKRRKTHSPDDADALCLAFYKPRGKKVWIA